MNNRKYNTDPDLLLAHGKAIMSSSDETRYLFRVFVVNMVLSGFPASKISEMAGVSKMAVSGWVKTVDEQGFEALKSKSHSGRPCRLTDTQKAKIGKVLQEDPFKYGFMVWSGPSMSSYIKATFNIDMSVRQCQRLFHELGHSRIRPQLDPSKENEETAKQFRTWYTFRS